MIKNYCFFGERHSGTNFLEVFLHQNLKLKENNLRFKHWFDVEFVLEKNTSDTLFFFIVRDPYNWTYAMKKKPYHFWQEHQNLGWKNFLTTQWWSVTNSQLGGCEIMQDRNWMTGERYENILKMRTGKLYLVNFLTKVLKNTYVFKFEDFADHDLIKNKLRGLAYVYDFELYPYNSGFSFNRYRHRQSVINSINRGLDWTAESIFGYYPKLS